MKKSSNTAEEQNMFCDGPPGEGGGGGWRPLIRGCRYSDWGLRRKGFRGNP